jgi:hypothetical protein
MQFAVLSTRPFQEAAPGKTPIKVRGRPPAGMSILAPKNILLFRTEDVKKALVFFQQESAGDAYAHAG